MSVRQGPWAPQEPRRASPESFLPFSPANWQGRAAQAYDWLVDGCFLKGTVAMLSGDGGLGKSLLMQQLCTAAALGRPWLGMGTKPVRSLAIFCEDDRDELHRRQQAINFHYGCEMSDLEDIVIEDRAGRDSVLVRFEKWGARYETTPLWRDIRERALDHSAQIVVLDTRRDIFAGNEIDYQQARVTVRLLRTLAIETQGVVILTDHPSNEGLSSGSGLSGNRAWSNSVRSRLYLTRPPKADDRPDDRLLRTMKANSGPWGGKLALTWRHGVFVAQEPPVVRDFSEPHEAEFKF